MEGVKQGFRGIGKLTAIVIVGLVISLSLFLVLVGVPYGVLLKLLQ